MAILSGLGNILSQINTSIDRRDVQDAKNFLQTVRQTILEEASPALSSQGEAMLVPSLHHPNSAGLCYINLVMRFTDTGYSIQAQLFSANDTDDASKNDWTQMPIKTEYFFPDDLANTLLSARIIAGTAWGQLAKHDTYFDFFHNKWREENPSYGSDKYS